MADQAPTGRDPLIDRVNELTTTALDTLAVLAFTAGVWMWGNAHLGPGGSFTLAAVCLVLCSALAQHRQRPRAAKRAKPQAKPAAPGPADPGNLHVMGR